jgi:hypothetical protein
MTMGRTKAAVRAEQPDSGLEIFARASSAPPVLAWRKLSLEVRTFFSPLGQSRQPNTWSPHLRLSPLRFLLH